MIDQKTAFEYAKQLEEYVQAGNTIEQICACNERKQVMRFSYHIMQNPATPQTEEQIDKSILALDDQKLKLEEVKTLVVVEQGKIEAAKQAEEAEVVEEV